jgi:formate/nitrite transporter FocA (FNT family)
LISICVAYGFEHSIATMYFLLIGVERAAGTSASFSIAVALRTIAPLGNVLGETIFVSQVR